MLNLSTHVEELANQAGIPIDPFVAALGLPVYFMEIVSEGLTLLLMIAVLCGGIFLLRIPTGVSLNNLCVRRRTRLGQRAWPAFHRRRHDALPLFERRSW